MTCPGWPACLHTPLLDTPPRPGTFSTEKPFPCCPQLGAQVPPGDGDEGEAGLWAALARNLALIVLLW